MMKKYMTNKYMTKKFMNKKYLAVLIILLLFVAYSATSLFHKDPYQPRQVVGIPEQSFTAPLAIDEHIRHTQRPDETFHFPIQPGKTGPVKPLYAGALQYPFFCMTLDSHLGQPLVDNQQGLGVPVYDSQDNISDESHIIGYSKDCSLATQIGYLVELSDGSYQRYEEQDEYVKLYRVEQGTINRFIYTIIMPVTKQDMDKPGRSAVWNQKLIYQFQGGSGIGFRQGKARLHRMLERRRDQLHQGYAVISSTGNKTSYTYNMMLAEDTARRVKKQFTSQYSEPEYTVGIGGSGGGLSQYLIGQNSTGILDAAIPLYSYPDMISQTLYGLDCDLFNSYYSYHSDAPEFWQDWENRIYVEGMNAKNGETHLSAMLEPINQVIKGRWPTYPQGNSECINGWFGLSTFVHNPAQGFLRQFFNDDVQSKTKWNYWEDLVNLFGRDEFGYANSTWGNEGVQYGLHALKQGNLSKEQFIHLNWYIGSWKPAKEMEPEWLLSPGKNKRSLIWLSLWSRHNITEATNIEPAKRRSSSPQAIEAAYRSGQVFIGEIDIPIIDVRHYLEDQLDMHHMSATFSSRIRIQQAKGHHQHHITWVAHKDYNPVNDAFLAMDLWMQRIQQLPEEPIWKVKPEHLSDTCFDSEGTPMHQGANVWDGQWNGKENGACTSQYNIFSNSRIQADGPWQGSVFSCHLISVEQAIKQGFYGSVDMMDSLAQLKQIFPNGVCDYSQGDLARPSNI